MLSYVLYHAKNRVIGYIVMRLVFLQAIVLIRESETSEISHRQTDRSLIFIYCFLSNLKKFLIDIIMTDKFGLFYFPFFRKFQKCLYGVQMKNSHFGIEFRGIFKRFYWKILTYEIVTCT